MCVSLGPCASITLSWPCLNHVKASHAGQTCGPPDCIVPSNVTRVDREVHNVQAQVAKYLVARWSSVVASAL